MKCLFVHDFRSYHYLETAYCTNLSYEIWSKRYLPFFDNLVILNRTKDVEKKPKGLVISSGSGVIYAKKINLFKNIDFFIHYSTYKKIIQDYIINSDAVIIRLDSFLGLIAAKLCRKMNKPYIIEVVGCVWDSFWNKGTVGKLLAPCLYIKTKKEIYQCKYVIYVTKAFLQKRYPSSGKNINCSNVCLQHTDDRVLARRLLKIDALSTKSKIIIGTIAALDIKYKGQQYVIRAISYLKKQGYSNFEYHLVGGGNQLFLKKLVKKYDLEENIRFIGPIEHEKINIWLDSIDIYIQPSRQEGLPRALIEAMSRGLPCLGAKTAGIPELLNTQCIFSNTHNNYKIIAKMLNCLTTDKMKKLAKENFINAKDYEEEKINKIRFSFFNDFKKREIG
ncbi:MAG: glycosyltransferase [Beduini sp.]|uniref:glycosyltransferase n=1 Tax=Beduini sp. TaxID=1922300 RepID=UPI0011C8A000